MNWIVNLANEQVEVYAEPVPAKSRYGDRQKAQWNETFILSLAPGSKISVSLGEILPW